MLTIYGSLESELEAFIQNYYNQLFCRHFVHLIEFIGQIVRML